METPAQPNVFATTRSLCVQAERQRALCSGFTLLETLVAIAVLALALIGPMVLAHNTLQGSRATKEKITASYLAQDALEYLKAANDTNGSAGALWLTGLSACTGANGCTVDTTLAFAGAFAACSGTCAPLRFDSTNVYYGYNAGWAQTEYVRTARITTITSDEVKVTVTITWNEEGIPHTFSLVEYWYRYLN